MRSVKYIISKARCLGLFLLFFCCLLSLNAEVLTDSTQYKTVDQFNEKAAQYLRTDMDSAQYYIEKALILSKQITYREGEADALFFQGRHHFATGKLEEAKKLFQLLSDLAEEIGYSKMAARSLNGLAAMGDMEGDYGASIFYLNRAIQIYESIGDMNGVITALNNTGIMYNQLGDDFNALKTYLRGLEIAEEYEFDESIALLSDNLGDLYSGEKALEYYQKALAIHEKLEDTRSAAWSHDAIGEIYRNNGQYEQAYESYSKSLELSTQVDHVQQIGESLFHLGELEYLKGNAKEALKNLLNVLELKIAKSFRSTVLQLIGEVYLNQGDILKSEKYSNEALLLAKAVGDPWILSGAYKQFASLNEAKGDYHQAFDAFKNHKLLLDSLNNEETIRDMTRLEADYEFNKEKDSIQFKNEKELLAKNQEIALLEEQEKVARILWALSIGIVLVLVGIGFFVSRTRLQLKAQEADKLKEIGQFKEAMTGMIAHDLKNPLGVILGTESEKPSTRNMARQMLSLVNNMLDVQKFEKAEVKLNLECVVVSQLLYESVEQVRMLLDEKNVAVHYEVDEHLTVDADCGLLNRVVINLLTNAIKYAPQNSTITMAGTMHENQVMFSVSDQGKGIPQHQIDEIFGAYQQLDPRHSGAIGSTGLGLTFCKLALQAHGSIIEVSSTEGQGTTFSFRLPQSVQPPSSVETREERTFRISEEDRKLIQDLLPALRDLKIHQAMQMETLLEPVRDHNEATRQWVDSVLNAAYNGNEEYFKELVEGIALQ